MASAGARAYNEGLGRSPQRGPAVQGQKPWLGARKAKPPVAGSLF